MSRYDRRLPQYRSEDACGTVVGLVLFVILIQAATGIDILGWLL